ncbi:MAG: TerC family protein [Gammaproteobacteria bacterium]|nr:TerC family protein [Gammaproteobacteria bacterium]
MFEALMATMSESAFWASVAQIIMIDILLGGDNAVVIALACRNLPEEQRRKGIAWGVAGAIGLRVVLIFFAIQLLALPFLNIVGALLLLWIGVKLLDCGAEGEHQVASCTTLFGAVKTIIIADAVMSLDNVVAVAGAAHGNMYLVVFGIAFSIPIILFGSHFVMRLMDRFPMVITLGAGLLGWIAGQMILNDALIKPMSQDLPGWVPVLCSLAGALFVVGVGKMRSRRRDDTIQEVSLLSNVNPPTGRPQRVRV